MIIIFIKNLILKHNLFKKHKISSILLVEFLKFCYTKLFKLERFKLEFKEKKYK